MGQAYLEKIKTEITKETEMGKSIFSIIMDENTDRSEEKQLAVVVKYFSESVLCTRLLVLIPIAEGNAGALFDALTASLSENGQNLTNCIGWSADPCNVMHGKHDHVSTRLKAANKNMIVVKCTCHSAALDASNACAVLPRSCEKLVHDIYNFFADSNKRSSEFHEFQEYTNTEPHKILKPCQTRWLSLHQCVSRILEHWDALVPGML